VCFHFSLKISTNAQVDMERQDVIDSSAHPMVRLASLLYDAILVTTTRGLSCPNWRQILQILIPLCDRMCV
jgi:hypothetical protein